MYKDTERSFIELCLNGEILMEEIDDFVDEWHESTSSKKLHDYLGMSWEEYAAWVAEPDLLPLIITAKREGVPLADIIEENERLTKLPLAARTSGSNNTRKVLDWLKSRIK